MSDPYQGAAHLVYSDLETNLATHSICRQILVSVYDDALVYVLLVFQVSLLWVHWNRV